jgi:hypothetical protein
MKAGYLKSSPHFFRLIKGAALLATFGFLLAPLLFPAPLGEGADPAVTPNPARSAWFLLWIQELVSWSRLMIYPVLAGTLLFLALPWLPFRRRLHRASWLPREQRWVNWGALLCLLLFLALTIVAAFFRGANWRLVF